MTTYNATSDTYVLSKVYKNDLDAVFKSMMFYSFWIGASILMFSTFLLLSTKAQRKACIFYLLTATFVMLLITSISTLVKENEVRQGIFDERLDRAKAAKVILQSEKCRTLKKSEI